MLQSFTLYTNRKANKSLTFFAKTIWSSAMKRKYLLPIKAETGRNIY